METTDEDTVLATYTYGNDLISMNRAGESSYYQYDGLGSVRQLTDNTGMVVAYYTYDAFGNLIASTGSTTNAYGFTGEQQFGEADGLVFLRARYYDSRIGRFISRDPILEPMREGDNFLWPLPSFLDSPQKLNPYVYCVNNPVNIIDPTGKESCSHCQDKCANDATACYKKCLLEGNVIKVIFCRFGCYLTDRNCKTACLDKPAI
jgi:RHS repeat-associated protein